MRERLEHILGLHVVDERAVAADAHTAVTGRFGDLGIQRGGRPVTKTTRTPASIAAASASTTRTDTDPSWFTMVPSRSVAMSRGRRFT